MKPVFPPIVLALALAFVFAIPTPALCGCIQGDCENGKGTMLYPNGERYEGEFSNYEKHGIGSYTWPDGGRFHGEFQNSDINGRGVMVHANGDRYEGEFKNWERHGRGTLTRVDGSVVNGQWNNGELTETAAVADKAAPPAPVDEKTPPPPQKPGQSLTADHNAAAAFNSIPGPALDKAGKAFNIFYGHTSHGSQIMTGLEMILAAGGPGPIKVTEREGDLGHEGDLDWERQTREILTERKGEFNMIMWSWCGGVSDNNSRGIDAYLQAMDQLERDHPGVIFIYMTGHLDKDAPRTLKKNNNRIREWCAQNNKILFDFADIETYDPDGRAHPKASDACEWCRDWCRSHDCQNCDDCAHSHCLNCRLKGQAFWWLLARLSGWGG